MILNGLHVKMRSLNDLLGNKAYIEDNINMTSYQNSM